jgi:hypothetical protein
MKQWRDAARSPLAGRPHVCLPRGGGGGCARRLGSAFGTQMLTRALAAIFLAAKTVTPRAESLRRNAVKGGARFGAGGERVERGVTLRVRRHGHSPVGEPLGRNDGDRSHLVDVITGRHIVSGSARRVIQFYLCATLRWMASRRRCLMLEGRGGRGGGRRGERGV